MAHTEIEHGTFDNRVHFLWNWKVNIKLYIFLMTLTLLHCLYDFGIYLAMQNTILIKKIVNLIGYKDYD